MTRGDHGRSIGLTILVVALAIGFVLRSTDIAAKPFWLDEAYSAFAAEKGFAFIWFVLPGYETHPPLYSALLRLWTLIAGTGVQEYRLFGVIAGSATLVVIGLAARELAAILRRPELVLVIAAVLIAATLATFVEVSRTVRPYALIVFANACTFLAVLRIVRIEATEARLARWPFLAYLAGLVLLVWLHNLGALYAAAAALFLMIAIGPKRLLTRHAAAILAGHGVAAACMAPALLILADQAPTWASSTWLSFRPERLAEDMLTLFGLPGPFGLAVALLLSVLALRTTAAETRRMLWGLLLAALLPVALALALTIAIAPVFLPRTLVAAALPLILLMAAGVDRRLFTQVALAGFCVLSALRAVALQALPPEQDWYGVIAWLAPRMGAADAVYAYPNEGALPLRFALRDRNLRLRVRPLPTDIPARDHAGWYPTGSRGVQSLPPARLAELAADAESRRTPTIWLLRLRKSSYDPRDAAVRAFSAGRAEVARYRYNDIEIRGLRALAQPAPAQQP